MYSSECWVSKHGSGSEICMLRCTVTQERITLEMTHSPKGPYSAYWWGKK
jgi:hypothetical protein